MRRYLAAGIWLALTVTATLIVWAAVSVVAANVTDRPAPVVAHRDVVVALEAGSTQQATTTTTSTTTTVPRANPTTTTVRPASPTTTAPGGHIVSPSGPVFGQATTTTTIPSPVATRAPPHPSGTTTTTLPVGRTATFSTDGGVIGVGCTSFNTIRLLAALPNDGFQAVVTTGGPLYVQVNFVGQSLNVAVYAACFFGQPFEFNKTPPTS